MSTKDRQQLLRDAAEAVLAPLARLCVSSGLPFAQAEELFKRAYVRAAREARREAGKDSTGTPIVCCKTSSFTKTA